MRGQCEDLLTPDGEPTAEFMICSEHCPGLQGRRSAAPHLASHTLGSERSGVATSAGQSSLLLASSPGKIISDFTLLTRVLVTFSFPELYT